MGIEKTNVVLGQNINGASYASDKFGGLIGWYDYNLETLYIDERYKHIEKLLQKCINNKVQVEFCLIEEPEILKYFAERRIRIRNAYYEAKELLHKHDKQYQLIPFYKKVHNAESKIKKRHG